MQFPTMAQKAVADWDHKGSFNILAKRRGAFRDEGRQDDIRTTEWVFDDDSIVVVAGRGRSHKIVAELP